MFNNKYNTYYNYCYSRITTELKRNVQILCALRFQFCNCRIYWSRVHCSTSVIFFYENMFSKYFHIGNSNHKFEIRHSFLISMWINVSNVFKSVIKMVKFPQQLSTTVLCFIYFHFQVLSFLFLVDLS